MVARQKGSLVATAWLDNRVVSVLSTTVTLNPKIFKVYPGNRRMIPLLISTALKQSYYTQNIWGG